MDFDVREFKIDVFIQGCIVMDYGGVFLPKVSV